MERDVTLKPEHPVDNISYRKIVCGIEKIIQLSGKNLGKDPFPLKHSFAEGVYIRELFIPKGALCVGALHKESYANFIMSGDMSVITEDGFKRVSGPSSVISPPMTKRFGYSHSDTYWITVHPNPNNCTDIDKLEEEIHLEKYDNIDIDEVTDEAVSALREFREYLNETESQFCMDRFRELTYRLHVKEKTGFWSDWSTEEQEAYMSGDWEEFSRIRGYEDSDIEELREWLTMYEAGIKLGFNPLENVMDILARSVARNLVLDTKGEILKSSHIPSLSKEPYLEVV